MTTIKNITFPPFAVFEWVDRKDGKGRQLQFRTRNTNDGRELIIVPDAASLAPLEGISVPVTPNRVIFDGPSRIIVTCFVPEKFSAARQVMANIFAKPAKQAEKPKPAKKPCSGQYVGDPVKVRVSVRGGSNILTRSELERQEVEAAARRLVKAQKSKKPAKKAEKTTGKDGRPVKGKKAA